MTAPLILHEEHIETPTGAMRLITDGEGALRAADWESHGERMNHLLDRHYGKGRYRLVAMTKPSRARTALEAYFSGDIAAIDAIPTKTAGTEFQRAVWAALRKIPSNATTSYSALAGAIGRPKAVRAVGLANGANPIPVVVPCHRVIGASGALTGYGGGLERKRWLLDHERTAGEGHRKAATA
jgi:methylated-DNA-[protein]-cysteine S-methyltransferase